MRYDRNQTVKQCLKHRSSAHLLMVLVAILLVSIIALPGCNPTPEKPSASTQIPPAVPQRADFLGKIELAEIINDEDFIELYREIAAQEPTLPKTLDTALDEVQCETGVNLRDFADVIVFADASTLLESMETYQDNAGPAYWGALVEGALDENTFIDSIESEIGRELVTSDYQNSTIYSLADTREPDEAFSMAFPAEGQMVIGTALAVRDVIDVIVGLEEPISGTVYDLYAQLGDALIKLASSVPESLTEQIPAEMPVGPLTLSLLSFRDIEYATLTLGKSEAVVNTELCLVFSNEDSAEDSRWLLWTASKLGKNVVPDPEVGDLLPKVQISRSGSSVSLTLALAMSEIELLAQAILQEKKQ